MKLEAFVPKENTYHNVKEAWTLEVILAINLKSAFFYKGCDSFQNEPTSGQNIFDIKPIPWFRESHRCKVLSVKFDEESLSDIWFLKATKVLEHCEVCPS